MFCWLTSPRERFIHADASIVYVHVSLFSWSLCLIRDLDYALKVNLIQELKKTLKNICPCLATIRQGRYRGIGPKLKFAWPYRYMNTEIKLFSHKDAFYSIWYSWVTVANLIFFQLGINSAFNWSSDSTDRWR